MQNRFSFFVRAHILVFFHWDEIEGEGVGIFDSTKPSCLCCELRMYSKIYFFFIVALLLVPMKVLQKQNKRLLAAKHVHRFSCFL